MTARHGQHHQFVGIPQHAGVSVHKPIENTVGKYVEQITILPFTYWSFFAEIMKVFLRSPNDFDTMACSDVFVEELQEMEQKFL